eukprot:CAMPEP_0181534166 /NCGR_PEP_ID=MMETSP1110-20121109/73552_1 /TAXON_ID=174948 /ORGANISM="Symbiodinium sp., Strain CCMP421" /LENGTH=44 /DNA_ID= /DNA_START= /DNA_END= /DNA_ORIENTATION=
MAATQFNANDADSDHGFSFSDERSNVKFNFSPRQGGISSMATSA